MNSGLWFSDPLWFLLESLLSSCGAWRCFGSYRDGWGWGGGAQGPTSCLKWNRSPFTCMICRTLHEILFYKRVLAFSVCYLCNKALPKCSYRQVGRACHTAGCSSGTALPGLWVSQGGSHPSWTSGPGRLRLGTGLPSLPKQITWPNLKSLRGAVHGSQCGCDQVTDAEMVEELGPVMQSTPTTIPIAVSLLCLNLKMMKVLQVYVPVGSIGGGYVVKDGSFGPRDYQACRMLPASDCQFWPSSFHHLLR